MLPTLALEMKASQRTDVRACGSVKDESCSQGLAFGRWRKRGLAGSRAPVSVTLLAMAQACFGSSHPIPATTQSCLLLCGTCTDAPLSTTLPLSHWSELWVNQARRHRSSNG